MERFRRAVEVIFNNWSALEIAVNQSGARDSTQIILGMIDVVVATVFTGEGAAGTCSGGHFDDQDLIDYLTETVDDEFNTICEDNSPEEIVEVLKKLYECVALGVDPLQLPEIKRLSASKNWIPTPTTPLNSEADDLVVTLPNSPQSPSNGSKLASKMEELSLSPMMQDTLLSLKPCDEGLLGPVNSGTCAGGKLRREPGSEEDSSDTATPIGRGFSPINESLAVERTEVPTVGVQGEEETLGEEEALDGKEASDGDGEEEEPSVVRICSGKPGAKKNKKKYNNFRYTLLPSKNATGSGAEPYGDEDSTLEEAEGGVELEDSDFSEWKDVKTRKRK